MVNATILVVDDDVSLLELIKGTLAIDNHEVITAQNGQEGISALEQFNPDVIVLDIMMPRLDGLEVIRRIRQQSTVPIIMLTALDQESDLVQAFKLGADDYLTKPFNLVELRARVQAILRRQRWQERTDYRDVICFGTIEIDSKARRVLRDGKSVPLTMTEYKLLLELASHPDTIFTHKMLLNRIWGQEYGNESQYVRVYIGRLRRKLEDDPTNPRHLLTDPGIGYHLEL